MTDATDPRSVDWTIEDMVHVCHKAGMRVNFSLAPNRLYPLRLKRTNPYANGMNATAISLMQRGYHAKKVVRLGVLPYRLWRDCVRLGMHMRRAHDLGIRP